MTLLLQQKEQPAQQKDDDDDGAGDTDALTYDSLSHLRFPFLIKKKKKEDKTGQSFNTYSLHRSYHEIRRRREDIVVFNFLFS